MDKYEFNIKVEQIKKMVGRGDYETAMKIADTIDWRRVRNINILSMVATIYEKNEEYREAKDILLLAFERAPIGKRLLFKLAELAVREGSIEEAEDYYREFCDLAPDDPGQYILRYLILKAKGAPAEQLIHTLEQYCNVELDEKWLYELAALYDQAGMDQLCVMACDKLMLMFGLGKYVDKAMELKTQHAPLTGYQMDLVENRDKYEARLRAVEQEFGQNPSLIPAEEVQRRRDEKAAREAAYTREPEPFVQPEVIQEDQEELLGHQSPYEEEARDDSKRVSVGEDEIEENAFREEEDVQEEASEVEVQEEEEQPLPEEWEAAGTKNSVSDEAIKARLHEARVQEDLARELSRISDMPEISKEDENAQTRVLSDIRHLNRRSAYNVSNHLMIEASVPEEGFKLAVEALKKIHHETGANNQVAKITGDKLNRRGIFTISDKIIGRDLIIEQAGDMSDAILQELNQLMARDETGMNIVLIDTAERLEELHRVYPGLAKRFECIGTSDALKAPRRTASESAAPVKTAGAVRPRPAGHPEAAVRRAASVLEPAEEIVKPAVKAQPKTQPALKEESRQRPLAPERDIKPQQQEKTTGRASAEKDERLVRRVQLSGDNHPALSQPGPKVTVHSAAAEREKEPEKQEEMDIDEFVQYACDYASGIDCSISGKSMLALYERVEMMDEDGVPLTKANAEDLIEEAADRAEKPGLLKRITGAFSSKYDKEGLLILKEEHFI